MKYVRIICLFLTFSFLNSEQFFIVSYKDNLVNNKILPKYSYYYKKNLLNFNIDFFLNYTNPKENSLSFYSNWFLKNLLVSVNTGNYFLNPFWNQFVFLADDIMDDINFPIKRKFKGVYISLYPYNLTHYYGLFYLEDQSKGFYLHTKEYAVLFDFFNKNYMYYHNLKSKFFYYYINIGGEKNNVYGYSSLKIIYDKINYNFLQLFIIRNPIWDQYDYFQDNYKLDKKFSKSFLSNLNGNYNKFFLNFNYFNKGNTLFTKSTISIKVFNLNRYNVKVGFHYLQNVIEKKYKQNNTRYSIEIENNSNYNYNVSYEWSSYESLIKLYIGKRNKNLNLYSGFIYLNYNLKQNYRSFDFFTIYLDDNQIKNYLVERSNVAIFSELSFKSNFLSLYLNYTYQKKFINKSNKDIHNLNIKFSLQYL